MMKVLLRLTLAAIIFALFCGTATALPECDPHLKSDLGGAVGDAQLIMALGRINLGPFEISQIPKGAIVVDGAQLVGKEFFFTFHVKIDARNSATKPSFTMAGPDVGGAMVRGSIRRLQVDGCITIPGRSPEPRLEIPTKNFFADVLTPEAALPTTMAGVLKLRGNFVELRNVNALRLLTDGGRASSGIFELAASNATTDAMEIIAEGSKRSLVLKASFQLPGTSRWIFDLSNPKIRWQAGTIRASPVSLTADQPYVMPLPRLDLEFRQLNIAEISFERTARTADAVSITLKSLELNAGQLSLLGNPSVKGSFQSPFKTSGAMNGTFTDDGQIVVKDYALTNVTIDLAVGEFSDAGSVHLSNSRVALHIARLTASELEGGDLSVEGGNLSVSGTISGTADIQSIKTALSGKREALNGHGTVGISKLSIHGPTSAPVMDKCPGNNLNVDIKGADATNVTGDINVVEGKVKGTFDVTSFKAAVGLSYYRCEWDHVVGHLNKVEMNGIPYPCPTWSEPFKFCQDHWVLWGGGDVSVRWVLVLNPTITDVGVQIDGLKYDLEKSRVCGGFIKGLTLGLYAVSITPNFPGSGTVFDVFRDAIQLLMGTWQTALVNTLGPAIGALGVVQLECK
jgi:hypothetical protein